MGVTAFLRLVVVAATAGPVAVSAQNHPADRPSFTAAASELVVLPVIVTDRQGRLISDLGRDRFVVLDEGRRQDLVLFTGEDVPVSIAVAVDDSGSMGAKLGQVMAAALTFARASHPQDELFVIGFNDSVRDLLRGHPLEAGDTDTLEAALLRLVPQGRTALYDALTLALDRLSSARHARKVVLLLSDGGDNASETTLDQVLARARASNVAIYTVGLYDAGASDTNPAVLRELAAATGGDRFFPRSPGPLLQACLRIAREIRSGYTLGFVPPDRDGRFHAVTVHVRSPEGRRLRVRTRPGYFAAKEAAVN